MDCSGRICTTREQRTRQSVVPQKRGGSAVPGDHRWSGCLARPVDGSYLQRRCGAAPYGISGFHDASAVDVLRQHGELGRFTGKARVHPLLLAQRPWRRHRHHQCSSITSTAGHPLAWRLGTPRHTSPLPICSRNADQFAATVPTAFTFHRLPETPFPAYGNGPEGVLDTLTEIAISTFQAERGHGRDRPAEPHAAAGPGSRDGVIATAQLSR